MIGMELFVLISIGLKENFKIKAFDNFRAMSLLK